MWSKFVSIRHICGRTRSVCFANALVFYMFSGVMRSGQGTERAYSMLHSQTHTGVRPICDFL